MSKLAEELADRLEAKRSKKDHFLEIWQTGTEGQEVGADQTF